MAKRRMFSPGITIDSDAFGDMPHDSQLLYFYLALRADDDGFVANPKAVMRMGGFSEDNYKILVTKKYIIPFDSGIVVIRHWKLNNYIQKDRYTETLYQEEKAQLTVINGTYMLIDIEINRKSVPELPEINSLDTTCIQNGYADKVRLDKNSLETTTTTSIADDSENSEIPTLEQVKAYIQKIGSPINPEQFYDEQQKSNWQLNGKTISWKALVRIREKFGKDQKPKKQKKPVPSHNAEAKELFEAYGTLCPSLPKAQRLTADRKKAVSQILNKGYTVEQVKQAFRMAEESPFLRGERNTFHADFDWFFKRDKSGRDNLLKILEGKYTDHSPKQNQPFSQQNQPRSEEEEKFFSLWK